MDISVEPGTERKDQGTLHLLPVLNHSTFSHPLCFLSRRSFYSEREQLSLHFHPGSSFFVLRLFLSTSAFSIYHSDRALCFLESSVGDRGSMKRGDDQSEVRGEVIVDTNRGGCFLCLFSFFCAFSGFPFSVSI